MTIPRMVPRLDLSSTTIERADGALLAEGTLERSAWARKLSKTVEDMKRANSAMAARSEPIGVGYLARTTVVEQTEQPKKSKLGRKLVQYLNLACGACGAQPGHPCNSSVPLEEGEDTVHFARVKAWRETKS